MQAAANDEYEDWYDGQPLPPEYLAELQADFANPEQGPPAGRYFGNDFRRRSITMKELRVLRARQKAKAPRPVQASRAQGPKSRASRAPRKSAKSKTAGTAPAPAPEPPGPKARAHKKSAPSPVRFTTRSANRKLSPIVLEAAKLKSRPVPVGPFVATTSVSISATCSNTCAFKNNGCYGQTGYTGISARKLDEAARGLSSIEVIRLEAEAIWRSFHGRQVPQDGARGGRDLRLHVFGDAGSEAGAELLGEAAEDYMARGGARPWTFTNDWGKIRREAWGPISVLASVTSPEEIEEARRAGYAAAIVVERFPSRKAFHLPGSTARIIACPAEVTKKTTCVECRLCLDADNLLAKNVAIAFEAHGPGKRKVVQALVQLGLPAGKRGLPVTMEGTGLG